MTTTTYNLRHGTDYTTIWNALESQILFVVDEQGVCMSNGQVRHLLGDSWLYCDDQDGYQIMSTAQVERLDTVEVDPQLGYDRNGEVVEL